MWRGFLGWSLAALLSATLAPAPASAQSKYPDRTIRLVIPFPPGGVYDTIGRPLAERLKARLGNIVIENMAGASGARGAAVVARAAPDGYTLLLGGTSEMVIVPLAANQPLYDPIKDFEAIARLGVVGVSFVVNPQVPARNLKELIDYAKANPGKLSFGSPGAGSLPHLTGEMFKTLAEAPGIVHVPYSGSGPSLNDVVGGHIPLAMATMSAQVLELHHSGKVRVLALTTTDRIKSAANVPTAVESGLAGLVSMNFLGLFAPKGTPAEVVQQIAKATGEVLAEADLKAQLIAGGFEPDANFGPDQLRGFLQGELDRFTPVVKSSGFKVN